MDQEYGRPLAPRELAEKALSLIEGATYDFDLATEKDRELEVRRQGSKACEDAFHALVVLTDAILAGEGIPPKEDHSPRILALMNDLKRMDLADLYRVALRDLHHEGYDLQVFGPVQESTLRRVQDTINAEIEKYGLA